MERNVLKKTVNEIREAFDGIDKVYMIVTKLCEKERIFKSSLYTIHVTPLGKIIVKGKHALETRPHINMDICHEKAIKILKRDYKIC